MTVTEVERPDGAAEARWGKSVPWILITLIYSLTHGLLLFNRGLFWDDWVFWRQSPAIVAQVGRSMGSIWPSQINYLFYYSQAGITFNRAVTFLSFLIVAYLLFDIVRRLPSGGESSALWVAIVFSVFPVYQARVAMVMVGYGLCLMLFTFASWLIVRFGPHPSPWVRVLIVLLFLGSFQTASLLVFYYAVVPALILLSDPPEDWRIRSMLRDLVRHFDLMAAPVLFWVAKQIWLRPSGLYKDYNEIGAGSSGLLGDLVHGILNSVVFSITDRIPGALVKGVVHPGLRVFVLTLIVVGGVALIGTLLVPLARRGRDAFLEDAGMLLIVAAVFPYAAVAKIPANTGWETRHQLLVPVGAALLVVGIARSRTGSSKAGRVIVSVLLAALIGISAAIHVGSYITYQRDWLKQEAMIEGFRRTPEIERGRFIIIDDRASNWNSTVWPAYTYTGMAYDIYGDQKRMFIQFMPGARWWEYATARPYFTRKPYYKTGDYQGQNPDTVVTVRKGKLNLSSIPTVLRLTMLDCFDRPALRREIGNALTFTVRKYRAMPLDPDKP